MLEVASKQVKAKDGKIDLDSMLDKTHALGEEFSFADCFLEGRKRSPRDKEIADDNVADADVDSLVAASSSDAPNKSKAPPAKRKKIDLPEATARTWGR